MKYNKTTIALFATTVALTATIIAQFTCQKLKCQSTTSCLSNIELNEGYLAQTYKHLSPLMTDFYQLTMSAVFFAEGRKDEQATFYMHWRTPPFKGVYTLASGLEAVVDFLKNFKFTDEDISYLRTLKDKNGAPLFNPEFLKYLLNTQLDLDVSAVAEGTIMLGQGPVIRVSGPLIQCQLVESALLNIMNASSMVSTRASRLSAFLSQYDASCVDFSLRRAPSLDTMVARAAYIGGVERTASVHAGQLLNIPVVGTMAHSFITSFQKDGISNSEVERLAFKTYLKNMPGNSVLLVDTFDAKRGLINAIEVCEEMHIPLNGIRLDSGDLYELGWYAAEQLETAKKRRPDLFTETQIFMTDGLDEEKIQQLFKRSEVEKGKPFPVKRFGVGTKLGNPGPFNGGVYKLAAFKSSQDGEMISTMKLSGKRLNPDDLLTEKASLPGAELNTLRLFDAKGKIVGEVIVDTHSKNAEGLSEVEMIKQTRKAFRMNGDKQIIENLPAFETSSLLLQPIFARQKNNKPALCVYDSTKQTDGTQAASTANMTKLKSIRKHAVAEMNSMPTSLKDFTQKTQIPLYISISIHENAKKIIDKNQPKK